VHIGRKPGHAGCAGSSANLTPTEKIAPKYSMGFAQGFDFFSFEQSTELAGDSLHIQLG